MSIDTRVKRSTMMVALIVQILVNVQPIFGQDTAGEPVDGGSAGTNLLFLPMTSKGYTRALEFATERTINIPYFAQPGSPASSTLSDAQWTESGIVWFGVNEQGANSRNYADVRVAYSSAGLHVRATPIDYYLWFPDDPPASTDLTQWDSFAIQLDTTLGRASRPQSSDYQFLTAANIWVNPGKPDQYRRDARGNGSGWNQSWATTWTSSYGMVWSSNPGPNNNGGELDYGGDVIFTVPWASLGLSGPPAQGTVWGVSFAMYDRDGAGSGNVLAPTLWPDLSDPNTPSTWGLLHFGRRNQGGGSGTEVGRTVIRNATSTGTRVQDAWVGGGGNCSGGHNGGSNDNHGDDTSLFIASQALSADFPCFSRSYLKFDLTAVPANATIISATLTLMQWGGAGSVPEVPVAPQSSYVQVFSLAEDWNESTIHWNNAPMAMENVSGAWMAPRAPGADPVTGDPTHVNLTDLVRSTLQTGQVLNIAIYSADTGFHSSKYLGSSEAIDQYAYLRPTLTVVWGATP
jgi:hypothetical protein